MPDTINTISKFTPTRHMGELAWHVIAQADMPIENLIGLAVFTLVFGLTAWGAIASDTRRRFG